MQKKRLFAKDGESGRASVLKRLPSVFDRVLLDHSTGAMSMNLRTGHGRSRQPVETPTGLSSHEFVPESEITLPRLQDTDAPAVCPENEAMHGAGRGESFGELKENFMIHFERTYLQKLLVANHGNISQAVRQARKNRRARWELVRKHGTDGTKLE